MGLHAITSQSRHPHMREELPRSPTSPIPATLIVDVGTKVVVSGSASLGSGWKEKTCKVG